MNKTRWATIVVVAALSLVALWAALSNSAAKSGTAQTGGEPSTPLTLVGTTLDGRRYDLTKYRGTPVVINFFASWCPSCAKEAGDLTAFARSHPEVAFVGVDIRDTRAKGREWVMKYDVPFPVVFDREGTIASRYGVVGIPATFFLDRRGVERAAITGPSTLQGFEEKLQTVL
jgi:cytochrome c biogenesis protein CcmG/thiol:disulfide interchange protein DsbE